MEGAAPAPIIPTGGHWEQPWGKVRATLTGPDAAKGFECQMEVARHLRLSLHDVQSMKCGGLAMRVWELRLTSKAPGLLVLPNLPARPALIPEVPEAAETMPEDMRAALTSFANGEAVFAGEGAVMDETLYAMEDEGWLLNERDEFGDLWSITEEGRELAARLGLTLS